MWLVGLYLVGYFLLVTVAFVTLSDAGILEQLPRSWVIGAAAVALLLGVFLAAVSYPRRHRPPPDG